MNDEDSVLGCAPLEISPHASRRLQQRGLRPQDVALAIGLGVLCHRAGAVFFFVGRRACWLEDRKLEGLTVVLDKQGRLLTAYKSARALRRIKAKRRYSRSVLWRRSAPWCFGGGRDAAWT
jgi:hypothetical protein